MDCRAALWFVVVVGVLGCTPSGTMPLTSPSAESSREANLPKRNPQPATCVALGQCKELQAEEANIGPVQQERLRDDARKSYQQALHLDPSHLPAYRALAQLYVKLNDADRAEATFEKALKLHPSDGALWQELALCQCRFKRWDPAIASLQKAIECDPENRVYLTTLGHLLARSGRMDEALACFTQVAGRAQAHYNVARMMLHLKQPEQARAHLRVALEANPQLEGAQQLLVQLEKGQPEQPGQLQTESAHPIINVGFEEIDDAAVLAPE
jgi:tetratricopeptide (TPR) repeat protein